VWQESRSDRQASKSQIPEAEKFSALRVSTVCRAVPVFLCLALLWGGAYATPIPEAEIAVKIIAINDFHGNLLPSETGVRLPNAGLPGSGSVVPAGGVEYLATMIERYRAANKNLVFVSAGDLVGASPLLSSAFDDEPTIEAMNLMGLDYNGVGNHEFDHGLEHLRRLHTGGCPVTGCKSGREFGGAKFGSLAANVVEGQTGSTVFPAYAVRDFGGVRIAFIGVTLKGTAALVPASGTAGLEFRDEVETVNRLVPELRRQGIETIVVLIHEGGMNPGHFNQCDGVSGPILELSRQLHPAVDVVVSGHTHQAYICRLPGRLLTSAGAYGRLVTEIELRIDRRSGDVVAATAVNHIVRTDLPKSAAQTDLLAGYLAVVAPLERRGVGRVAETFSSIRNDAGQSALGRMVATAQLEATVASAGAQIALMNPGGIRTPLEYRSDGTVTYGDAFALHPFGNVLITMTLSGHQILQLLEQQWGQDPPKMLQVSKGLAYSWSPDCPPGRRVLPESVAIHGIPLSLDASYRITANNFLAEGGDRFTMFKEGRERQTGPTDLEAMLSYLAKHSPVRPGIGQVSKRLIGGIDEPIRCRPAPGS